MTSTQLQNAPPAKSAVDEVKIGTVATLANANQQGTKKMPYRIS